MDVDRHFTSRYYMAKKISVGWMERTLGKGSYAEQCDHVVTIGHFQSCTKSDSKQWGLKPQSMAALQLSEAATSGGRN